MKLTDANLLPIFRKKDFNKTQMIKYNDFQEVCRDHGIHFKDPD